MLGATPTTIDHFTSGPRLSNSPTRGLLWLAIVCATLVVVFNSWLGDDSYITFRTIDNWLHGYGLRWNTAERVQSYTHPLWFLLVSALRAICGSMYAAALAASWSLAFLTFSLFTFRIAVSRLTAIVGLVVLASSKAFVHYSTSGLENVLTHALIALYWVVDCRPRQTMSDRERLFLLGLLAGFIALNRLDAILFVLPPMLITYFTQCRGDGSWLRPALPLACGFIPFGLWELFSIAYYGFPFPNTAYAKLSTGIGFLTYGKQGLIYLVDSAHFDPLLALIIPAGLVASIALKPARALLPYALGTSLYLVYGVKVGGDFMAGRFLSAPLLVTVIILSQLPTRDATSRIRAIPLAIVGVALLIGCATTNATLLPLRTALQVRYHGVRADERSWWGPATSLNNLFRYPIPNDPVAEAGRQARTRGRHVSTDGVVGYFGYEAGPAVHILDRFALCDPLLAHLPVNRHWMIGHFSRDIPEGYVLSLASGANRIEHPALAAYYGEVLKITRGSLFNRERWIAIWKMNSGNYDQLITRYLADPRK